MSSFQSFQSFHIFSSDPQLLLLLKLPTNHCFVKSRRNREVSYRSPAFQLPVLQVRHQSQCMLPFSSFLTFAKLSMVVSMVKSGGCTSCTQVFLCMHYIVLLRSTPTICPASRRVRRERYHHHYHQHHHHRRRRRHHHHHHRHQQHRWMTSVEREYSTKFVTQTEDKPRSWIHGPSANDGPIESANALMRRRRYTSIFAPICPLATMSKRMPTVTEIRHDVTGDPFVRSSCAKLLSPSNLIPNLFPISTTISVSVAPTARWSSSNLVRTNSSNRILPNCCKMHPSHPTLNHDNQIIILCICILVYDYSSANITPA